MDTAVGDPKRRNRVFFTIFAVLLFLTATVATSIKAYNERRELPPTLYFADVGQADAAYLVFRDGSAIVFDCGATDTGERLVGQMKKKGVKRIEALIISHAHDDHFGGVFDLISEFETECIVMPETALDGFVGDKFVVASEGVDIICARRGDSFEFSSCKLDVLSPSEINYDGDNGDSLVVMLEALGTRVLFTGDIESETEEELVELYGNGLDADILKVAHHGSKTSSSGVFLDAVSPSVAVISVSEENYYGMPSSLVIDRLSRRDVTVYRTDLDGLIAISFVADDEILIKTDNENE